MQIFRREKKTVSATGILSRDQEARIVGALSRGNISLQMGKYLTEEDIEAMRSRVLARK